MKQVVLPGDGTVELCDRPRPKSHGDWVVIRVEVAPLCTEYKRWLGGGKADWIGHEAAGTVVEIDSPQHEIAIGDRVVVLPSLACGECDICSQGFYMHCKAWHDFEAETGSYAGRGTLAQYVLRPSYLLYPIPEDISLDHAALSCCGLGPTFGAMQKAQSRDVDTVLISGAGPVGLGGVVNGIWRNRKVIVSEPSPQRRNMATNLGAHLTIDPGDPNATKDIQELTDNEGVQLAVECSGTVAGQKFAMETLSLLGSLIIVGESNDEMRIKASDDLIRTGISIEGNWHFNRSEYDLMFDMIRNAYGVDELISHRMPMADIEAGFKALAAGTASKVLLYPN